MNDLLKAAGAMAEALRPLLDIAAEVDRRNVPDVAHEMFLISAKEARTAREALSAYEAAKREEEAEMKRVRELCKLEDDDGD